MRRGLWRRWAWRRACLCNGAVCLKKNLTNDLSTMSKIQLDPDLSDKLRDKAKRDCRSLTSLVNVLLRRLLRLRINPKVERKSPR